MPIHVIAGPDGQEYEIEAPEGATDDEILAYARGNYQAAVPADPYRHPDGRLTEAGWQKEIDDTKFRRQKEIDETPFMENAKAGFARSFVTSGLGLKQAGTEALRHLASDSTGLTSGENFITRWADDSLARQQRDIDQERRFSQDLMGTGGGLVGNAAGHLTQLAIPGGAAKTAGLRSVFMPSTLAGNAAQGAALSGLQPVATGESRLENAGAGAAGGYAGALAGRGISSTLGGLAKLLPAFSSGMQEAAAGRALTEMADNPEQVRSALSSLLQNRGEIVRGSVPTTAEATGDKGLFGLQQTLSQAPEFNVPLTNLREANNAARVGQMRLAFGGANEEAAGALRTQRDAEARRALSGLSDVRGAPQGNPYSGLGVAAGTSESQLGQIAIKPVDSALLRLIQKNEKRPAVKNALTFAQALTKSGVRNAEDAYNVRKTLDDLMNGKIGGDQASSREARRELTAVKDILDRQMRKAYPEWGDYLANYKEASKKITQVKVGESLLERANAARSDAGEPVLGGSFLRAAGDLDSVAKRVAKEESGFRRGDASVLTQPQRDTVDAVRRDIERQMRASNSVRALGSPTYQNAVGAGRAQDAVGGAGVLGLTIAEPSTGLTLGILNGLRKKYGERTASLLNEAMLDPQRAAEILARTPPAWRDAAIREFVNLGGGVTSAGVATYQGSQPPLEIDISGGTYGPAISQDELERLRRVGPSAAGFQR